MNVFVPDHGYKFIPGHRRHAEPREAILPADWVQLYFAMSRAYAIQQKPGEVRLFMWQVEPINAITKYIIVIFIGPVQTGKSLMTEGVVGWVIDRSPSNIMWAYSHREKVEEVFDERLKPFIEEIPAIRQYWSGNQDDLTKTRIKLQHMIIRVAGAGIPKDIASHNAGFIVGDELGKWPKKKGWSPVKALRGRGQATRMLGGQPRELYCTSPRDDQDYSYIEAHREGTLFLKPRFPCPNCGEYQELSDTQIREKPNQHGNCDHSPTRIRQEAAAWYECLHCRQEIPEVARLDMADKVVWAADGETVSPAGKIASRIQSDRVVFNWNRLVDVTWTFSECLASYFEALNSSNPQDLQTYQNEDMARWVKLFSQKNDEHWLRAKCLKYTQYGPHPVVPAGVIVLLCGVDTHDTGFNYVVRGFGKGMESWLVRQDFIPCDMKDSRFQSSAEVNDFVMREIHRIPFVKHNDKHCEILFSLWDRGGHRSKDIDYIVLHNTNCGAYIGSTFATAPLIEQKKSGIYYGNTEQLSRVVGKQMESEIWHLPKDVSDEYLQQVLNQYDEEYVDSRGNKKKRWVKGDTVSQPDHYRDCENLISGAAILLGLQKKMFEDEDVAAVQAAVEASVESGNVTESRDNDTVNENQRPASNGRASINSYLRQGGWGL